MAPEAPAETTTKSPLTTAATYLSSTWQWICGARWVYIVSVHDFSTYMPQHTIIGCYSTQGEANAARDKAIENREPIGGKRVWRRYEEIEDGAYGTLVDERDNRRCDFMALVERMRMG